MKSVKRIGINVGDGYVAGINAVFAGTVLAGHELGWEVMVSATASMACYFRNVTPRAVYFWLGGYLYATSTGCGIFATSYPFSSMAEPVEPWRCRSVGRRSSSIGATAPTV